MEPREIIQNHLLLCDDVYKMLLEENTWLKTKKQVPSAEILEKKKRRGNYCRKRNNYSSSQESSYCITIPKE